MIGKVLERRKCIFGLSALWIHARVFVRAFVTRYLENRASDFDDVYTKIHLEEVNIFQVDF